MSGQGEVDSGQIYLEGYVKGMRTDSSNGTILLTLVISNEYKHDALRTTDDMGVLQEIVFTAKQMDDELDGGDGVDDGDDIDTGLGWAMTTKHSEGSENDGEQ